MECTHSFIKKNKIMAGAEKSIDLEISHRKETESQRKTFHLFSVKFKTDMKKEEVL